MSTFKYNVGPKPNGGFTTRAVPGPVADNTALLAAAASAAGITPEQAETAIRSLFAQILEHARGNGRVLNFLDHLSMRATSGGSSPEPDGFTTTESIKPDVQISFSAEVVQAWAGSLSIESQGEVGKVTPVIESIIRQSDKAQNKYTALGLVEMRGNHLNFDPADLAQGVFLKAGADPEVRVTEYAKISPGSVVILIPAGLTGALNVRVCTHINGSLRTATYTDTITNAP